MSTFSKTGFKTLNYNSFRPKYPQSFYKLILKYANNEHPIRSTLDIGCGTGIATFDMLNISETVVGTDLSASMVDTSNSLKHERCDALGVEDHSRIKFAVGDIDNITVAEPVDLITAAQCLHWSKDFDKFFMNAHKALNPGGTLAYWYYVDPIIVDFRGNSNELDKKAMLKAVRSLYMKYAYNDPKLIGPYWEQPGRTIIKNGYEAINSQIPDSLFKQVIVNQYMPLLDDYMPPSPERDLALVRNDATIADFVNYISTYSGYHNFLEEHPGSNILRDFEAELKQLTGWDEFTKLDMVFNTGYSMMKKVT